MTDLFWSRLTIEITIQVYQILLLSLITMNIDALRKYIEKTDDIHEVRRVLKEHGFLVYEPSTPAERVANWQEDEQHSVRQLSRYAQDLATLGCYNKAISIAQQITDKDIQGETLSIIAALLIKIDRLETAKEILDSIKPEITCYDSFVAKIDSLFDLAQKYLDTKLLTETNNVILQIESLTRELPDDYRSKSTSLNGLGLLYLQMYNREKALRYWDEYLTLALTRIKNSVRNVEECSEVVAVLIEIAKLGEYEKACKLAKDIPYEFLRQHLDQALKEI